MQLQISSAASVRLQVETGQVLTLPKVDELALEALNGAFWVTCGNRARDHVLKPGERMRLVQSRQVVLEALEPGVIQFFMPGGAAPATEQHAAARGPEPVCMRNHVQEERLQFRSLEFA